MATLRSRDPIFAFQGRLIDIGGWLVRPAHFRYVVLGVFAVTALITGPAGALLAHALDQGTGWGLVYGLVAAGGVSRYLANQITGETPLRGVIQTGVQELIAMREMRARKARDGRARTTVNVAALDARLHQMRKTS